MTSLYPLRPAGFPRDAGGARDVAPPVVSLALSLAIAFVAALPVKRLLIAKGREHAVVHGAHAH